MNETLALWLASRMMVERWREEMAEERAHRQPRRRRWRAWLRAGGLRRALGLAGRGRALRPLPADGPDCCETGCGA